MPEPLNSTEKNLLLALARQALESAIEHGVLEARIPLSLPDRLKLAGASFVTLLSRGQLRGCVGTVEAFRPLAIDVQENAVSAGFRDPRFPPVKKIELDNLSFEISVLSELTRIEYRTLEELLEQVRPKVDGVLVRFKDYRAIFLPKVWEKISTKEAFFDHLCLKMGSPPNLWKENSLDYWLFQTDDFAERVSPSIR